MATHWISTAEAAQRLGVKPATIYAYVSRGLLVSRRNQSGRGSLLDSGQVDALASGGRRGAQGRRRVHRFRSVVTSISHAGEDVLYYRGHEVAQWSREHDLADGVELILGARPGRGEPPPLPAQEWQRLATVPLQRRVASTIARLADTGWGTTTDPGTAAAEVARAVPVLVAALAPVPRPDVVAGPDGGGSLAARIVTSLTGASAPEAHVRALDALQIQLLDHGLTASTTATRAAASARAGIADCLLAGHAALHGSAHGAMSARVSAALAEEIRVPQPKAGASAEALPGFGHFLYAYGDPRADVVLGAWSGVTAAAPALAALDRLRSRLPPGGRFEPNIDAAIAVSVLTLGLASGAGPALFAWARTMGLAAHAVEEFGEEQLRWRGRSATRAAGPETW